MIVAESTGYVSLWAEWCELSDAVCELAAQGALEAGRRVVRGLGAARSLLHFLK